MYCVVLYQNVKNIKKKEIKKFVLYCVVLYQNVKSMKKKIHEKKLKWNTMHNTIQIFEQYCALY